MIDINLRIINWNVRGLNSLAHRETVLQLLKDSGPNLVCLQETKLQHINSSLALEFLGQRLNHLFYLPADGTRGGIALAWDDDLIAVTNPSFGLFSLSATVNMRLTGISFLMWYMDHLKIQTRILSCRSCVLLSQINLYHGCVLETSI